jgi:hypothetical protein
MAQYTADQLQSALKNAHSRGDTAAAITIAKELKKIQKVPMGQQVYESFVKDSPELGAMETAASLVTGAVAEPLAGLAGIAGTVLPGEQGQGSKWVEKTREALTYQPKTDAGGEMGEVVATVLTPLTDALQWSEQALGDVTYEATGSEALAAGAATIPTLFAEILGAKAASRRPNVDPKFLDESGQVKERVKKELDRYGATVDPEEIARIQRFEEQNIPATKGDVSQKLEEQKPERFLEELVTDEAGGTIRTFRKEQSESFKTAANNIVDGLGVPEEAGESIKASLISRRKSLKEERTKAYNAFSEAVSAQEIPVVFSSDISPFNLMDKGELRDISIIAPGGYKALSSLLNEFGIGTPDKSLQKKHLMMSKPDPLTLSNFERFRKRLVNMIDSDETGHIQRMAIPIKNALDERIYEMSVSLEKSGNPNIAALAKEARNSHIALKTEFDPKALTSQLIDSKKRSNVLGVEQSQVYNKIVANSAPIEQVDQVVESLLQGGRPGQVALGQLQAQIMMDLVDSGFQASSRTIDGQRIFGGAAFQNRYDKLYPKLESVFRDKPEVLDQIKRLRDTAKDLTPPSGAVPKGSSGFLMEALKGMGLFTMMNKVPGGGIFTQAIGEIGARAKNKKDLERALDNNPTLTTQAEIIASDYPSLAAVLGIGYLSGVEEE